MGLQGMPYSGIPAYAKHERSLMPITIPMHTIARILGRHGLGRVSVEALPGGQINASYLVDGQYVLRVNLRPDEHGKLAREQRVLAMVRDQVPVPQDRCLRGEQQADSP